jgi:hypothetical protein
MMLNKMRILNQKKNFLTSASNARWPHGPPLKLSTETTIEGEQPGLVH